MFYLNGQTNNHSYFMSKSSFILLMGIILSNFSFSQFSFVDDSTDSRIQSGAFDEIDKQFKLEKDNDFELRLWTFPGISDNSSKASLFILSYRIGNWEARLFQDIWMTGKVKEVPLKKEGLEQLWKQLNENDVLSIPRAYTLLDKKGDMIIQENLGTLYSFELLSRKAVRHYAYHCPKEFSNKYDYVPTYKKVALIVQYIGAYIGINQDLICLKSNEVEQHVSSVRFMPTSMFPHNKKSLNNY